MVPSCLLLTLALGLGAPAAPLPAPGQWPVDPPTIVRAFSPPAVSWGAGHRGVDLAASTGQPVRSMAAGVIGFVGVVAGVPVVAVGYPCLLYTSPSPRD